MANGSHDAAPARRRPWHAYEWWVALRLVRARRSRFLSVIGGISVLGILFGVASLNVVCSVSGGFERAIRERILGLYPHIVLLKKAGHFAEYRDVAERVRTAPHVRGATPATYDEMMAALGGRRAGVLVKGVDVATARSVSPLDSLMLDGARLEALAETPRVRPAADGRLAVAGTVALAAYTVVVPPVGGTPFVVEDFPAVPQPGRAVIRLVNALPDAGAVQLELEPGDETGLAAATRPVPPAAAAPYIEVPAGTASARVADQTAGVRRDMPPLELASGQIYTAVLHAPQDGEPRLRLVTDSFEEQQGELSRLRLLRLDAAPAAPLGLADEAGQPLGEPLPAGTVGPYLASAAPLPATLLAVGLAEQLQAKPGDVITLVTPLRGLENRMLGPFGMAPSSARFRVAGLFRSGYYEHDNRFALVNFMASRRFLGRGDIARWVEIRVDDLFLVGSRRAELRELVDPYHFTTFAEAARDFTARVARVVENDVTGATFEAPRSVLDLVDNQARAVALLKYQDLSLGFDERYKLIDWEEMNRNLYTTLKLQKVVLSVLFLVILLVASFNVIGSQIMLVHEKSRDIAILRAMGATAGAIRRIFFLQGAAIGLIGTTAGLVVGEGISRLVGLVHYPLDPKVYLISTLPVDPQPLNALLTALAALVCTFLASLYSAHRAALKSPIDGLRFLE